MAANRREAERLRAAGQEALARGAWEEARARFSAALALEHSPEVLEGLGLACWWLDDAAATFDAREQAYRLYRERRDRRSAARLATWLAWDFRAFRGENAVASGWLRRARRLLDGLEPGPEHAWLAVREGAFVLLVEHDAARAQQLGAEGMALGRALGLVDVEMVGLALEGLALVSAGAVAAGMQRLDEATAAAVSGELSDLNAVGFACCYLIWGCERVRDFERAAQWCERLKEFCRRWRIGSLFAVCRTHYGSVLTWSGAWEEAEAELAAAARELELLRPGQTAEAIARLAELRRRQGRLDEAAALLAQAEPHPLAQLGRAALALDRDEPAAAAHPLERYLRQVPRDNRTERADALELLVRARVALGQREAARDALAELGAIADVVGTTLLRASASAAAGLVAAADGDLDTARRALEDATDLFERSGARYEAARARLALARVLADQGRADAAAAEGRAALAAFQALGAAHDAARAAALVRVRDGAAGHPEAAGLTTREIEVLRLVSEGLSNQEIAARLVLSEHTVHRHVANILTKLSLPSRAAAVAYAVRHGAL